MLKIMSTKLVIAAMVLSSTTQAQQVFWKNKNIEIKFNGSSNVTTYNGIFEKVLAMTESYECGYNEDPVIQERAGTCQDVTCEAGAGKSPAWDAFYSAKKDAKSAKLALAIKGIGKTSADSLIVGNYFSSKPHSWADFKNEIYSAAAKGAIKAQVKTMVLSTYRTENMSNLGYAANSCEVKPYACNEVVVLREGGYVPQTCTKDIEKVIEQKAIYYTINVAGAVLLPTEIESIQLTLSGNPQQSTITSSSYNEYSVQQNKNSGDAVVLDLQAITRRQVALPESGLQSVTLISTNAQQATLQVAASASILPVNSTETLTVQYQVRTCQIGIFGLCGIGWDKTENFEGKITGMINSFNAPINLAPGRRGIKMEVEVKVFKQNSIYHSTIPITKTTQTITIK